MAGGIPSGATPQPTAGTPDPTTGFDATTMPGAIVAGGIANLSGLTQEQVTSGYQSTVQGNPTLTGYSATVFDGMSMDGSTSPFLVIIMMIADVLGLGGGSGGLGGFLGTIGDLILGGLSDIATIIGGILGGFLGILGASGSADDIFGIVQATAATIAANSAAIQAMQNAAAADSNNGANVFLNFSSADLTGFTTSFSATGPSFEIESGYVVLDTPSDANFTGYALYTDQPTDTDDQIVSVVYATSPGRYDFLGLAEGSAYNIIICRSNLAMTTYVYAAVGPFNATLHNVVDGADTVLATETFSEPTFYTGSAYSLQAGFGESAETYQILVNGGTLLIFEDTSSVTNIGEEYRYTGFGLAQNLEMVPSQVATFSLVDDSPAALIGDLFRAYSDVSTPPALTGELVPAVAPASFYSQVEYQSSNYTYTAATNTLQVSTAGIYVVKVGYQWAPNDADNWAYFGAYLFKNGVAYESGSLTMLNSPGQWPYYVPILATFIVPMTANDYIQPGYFSDSSPTADSNLILGDASAQGAIFECALINTGLASTSSS